MHAACLTYRLLEQQAEADPDGYGKRFNALGGFCTWMNIIWDSGTKTGFNFEAFKQMGAFTLMFDGENLTWPEK
jgi:hypothetical protein